MPENGSSPILEIAKATALASFIGIAAYAAWAKDWKFPDFELPERAPRSVETVSENAGANDPSDNVAQKTTDTPEPVQKFADSKYPGCDLPDLAMPDGSVWSSCEHGARTAYRAYSGKVCPNDGACKPESSVASQGASQSKAVMDALGSSVCEKGYRLPTKDEYASVATSVVWKTGRNGNRMINGAEDVDYFARFFKIPRNTGTNAKNVGYWASESMGGDVGGYFILTNSQALVFDSFPSQGLRYRCIRSSEPVVATIPDASGGHAKNAESRYLWCEEPDIELDNGQVWIACDLGASKPYSGTGMADCAKTGDLRSCVLKFSKYLGGANPPINGTLDGLCPDGYRIPTERDWRAAVEMNGEPTGTVSFLNAKDASALEGTLKLVRGGIVPISGGDVMGFGTMGAYWYAAPDGRNIGGGLVLQGPSIFFSSAMPGTATERKTVRCLKK